MAWNDKPTDAQLTGYYTIIKWSIPSDLARKAVIWLENCATRRDVSLEMDRIHPLAKTHRLNASNCFIGEIWKGFLDE